LESLALTIGLYVLGVLLIVGGLIGLVLPAIPGSPVIFAGILAIAWADGFERIGWPGLIVTGILAATISLVDYLAGVAGAKHFGASYWGLVGSFLGLLAGLPFGILGIVVGPVAGAILIEYLKDPNWKKAAKVGVGTFVGFVAGTALKYALALVLLGTAVTFYLI